MFHIRSILKTTGNSIIPPKKFVNLTSFSVAKQQQRTQYMDLHPLCLHSIYQLRKQRLKQWNECIKPSDRVISVVFRRTKAGAPDL